jgi:hypothetical protein
MSRGLVALLLVAVLVISGATSGFVSWAVTSSALTSSGTPHDADDSPGADGADGTDGSEGADGSDGTPGATGSTGPRGATGATGTSGSGGAGPPGAPGIDGADAVVAFDVATAPDSAVPAGAPGDPVLIGTPLVIAASPAVLVSWRVGLQTPAFSSPTTCSLLDQATGTHYASTTLTANPSAAATFTGSGMAELTGDTVLVLSCTRSFFDDQTWQATGFRATGLTFGV